MINLDSSMFAKKIAESDVVVLDVRTPEEFNSGHIPNAINIDSAIERNDEVKLGKFAAKCAIELDDILDCPEIAQLYGLKLGSIRCAANAIRLLNGQIYRAVALARVLREIEPDSIYIFGIE